MARALPWPPKLGDAFYIRTQSNFCKTSGAGLRLHVDKKIILFISPFSNAFFRYNSSNVQLIRQILLNVKLH